MSWKGEAVWMVVLTVATVIGYVLRGYGIPINKYLLGGVATVFAYEIQHAYEGLQVQKTPIEVDRGLLHQFKKEDR